MGEGKGVGMVAVVVMVMVRKEELGKQWQYLTTPTVMILKNKL